MIKRTAMRDFYQQEDLLTRRLVENIEGEGCPVPHSIDYDPPLIMGDRAAKDWFLANYAYGVSLSSGRPPAMGEVCAFFLHSEGDKMIVPERCFTDIQSLFTSLRETETRYEGRGLYKIKRRAMKKGIEDGRLDELTAAVSRCYGDGHPLIARNGIWEIAMPSLNLVDEERIDGGIHRRSIHTHVGNIDWKDAILSGEDFERLASESGEAGNELKMAEEYVMHMPISVLHILQRELKNGGTATTGYIWDMLEKVECLNDILECDLFGMRFVWMPAERKVVVSPVISEAHYNRVRGMVPEGRNMDVKECYIDIHPDFPADAQVLVGVKKLIQYTS